MPNPVLNKKTFAPETTYSAQEMSAGWAAGSAGAGGGAATRAGTGAMSVGGTIAKTLVLLAILVGVGGVGWAQVDASQLEPTLTTTGAAMLIGGLILGLILGLVTAFSPKASPFTAPLYAIAEGAVLGVISALYNAQFSGIVLQAVAATIGVFLVMLFLYTSRTIRVTPKLQMGIIAATLGVAVAYLFIFIASLFTNAIEVFSSGPIGIVFSVIVAGVAAFNLLLDFSFIEQGTEAGAPKRYEWYCGFGLLVTLVWLYLTILRLLAILRR